MEDASDAAMRRMEGMEGYDVEPLRLRTRPFALSSARSWVEHGACRVFLEVVEGKADESVNSFHNIRPLTSHVMGSTILLSMQSHDRPPRYCLSNNRRSRTHHSGAVDRRDLHIQWRPFRRHAVWLLFAKKNLH